jgi:hypothetical protein
MADRKYREAQYRMAEMELRKAAQRIRRAASHLDNGDTISAMSSIRLAAEAEAEWRRARRRATGKSVAEARCAVPGSVDREDENLEALGYA